MHVLPTQFFAIPTIIASTAIDRFEHTQEINGLEISYFWTKTYVLHDFVLNLFGQDKNKAHQSLLLALAIQI